MTRSPIGLAIVGAGYWGPNLVRTALATQALDLKWLCDTDVDRAVKVLGRHTTVRPTPSFDQVLDDPAVAAVAVATPAATHFELVSAALDAGKHVLVEKPLTACADEAEKVIAQAAAAGLTLMCDHTYCYTPAAARVRQAIREGELGELRFIDSVRINLGLVQPDVDVLWDLAPHDVSIMDFVLPAGVEPVAVAAHATDPLGAGHACLAYLSVWLSSGAIAHLHVNWLSPIKVRTTIFGGAPDHRLGRYEPGCPAHDPRPRRGAAAGQFRRGGRPAAGTDLLPARRHAGPGAARTGGAARGDGRVRRCHHAAPAAADRRAERAACPRGT
ncbi:MAG TPA: Gfo/Idh/MocA family oxidoreductase [Streptosporangiaceae bacterium]|nr:Gfo/Idh/MocA family oxidoreductase [Streptosporangiaceae bacterium]